MTKQKVLGSDRPDFIYADRSLLKPRLINPRWTDKKYPVVLFQQVEKLADDVAAEPIRHLHIQNDSTA